MEYFIILIIGSIISTLFDKLLKIEYNVQWPKEIAHKVVWMVLGGILTSQTLPF